MSLNLSLVLGDLELVDPHGSPFAIETLADGTGWGNPQPIEVAVRSLLQDGSIVVHQGDDNREVALRVVITAADSAALAEGEAALMAELYRPNTLTYTPADGWGPPTVFMVVVSSLAHVMDDLAEVRLNERHYSVRLVCEPFGRSEDEVVTEALPASGTTTTTVSDGSATTGWTSTDGTPSVVSGAVQVATSALAGPQTVDLTYTASISTSATPYLVVDWKANTGAGIPELRCFTGTTEHLRVAQAPSPTSGFVRSHFYVDATSLAAVRFEATTPGDPAALGGMVTTPVARSLSIDNLSRTDVRPSIGTARQMLRQIEVAGSARTPGSLVVGHASDALGNVIVYTWPDDGSLYVPALRRYRTTSGTSDSATVSGAKDNLASAVTYDIPLAAIPRGHRFLLVGKFIASAGTTNADQRIAWTAQTRIGGSAVGPALSGEFDVSSFSLNDFVTGGRIHLPLTSVGDATLATIRITLVDTTSDEHTWQVDELYLFDLTAGRLVMAPCGTGTASSGGPSRRLFIQPALLESPAPRVLRGHAIDGSDAFYALTGDVNVAWDALEFTPGLVNVLTVTTNATEPDVSLSYGPRWHTHAAS